MKDIRFKIRISERDKELIKRVAGQNNMTMSEFVRDKVLSVCKVIDSQNKLENKDNK